MPKKRNLPKGRKPTNEHQKARYAAHYLIAEKNRLRKQAKHQKRHPNDLTLLQS